MKIIYSAVLFIFTFFLTDVSMASSALRIACDGDNAGAEVFVNEKFKGQCPLDIQVQEGLINLKVQKPVDDLKAEAYEEKIRMGDGVVKKVEVKLMRGQLTVKGKQYYEKYLSEKLQKQEQLANAGNRDEMFNLSNHYRYHDSATEKLIINKRDYWLQKAANAGLPQAMRTLFNDYKQAGFPQGVDKARALLLQAAQAGDKLAMQSLSDAYLSGEYGLVIDREQATYWQQKAFEADLRDAEAGDPSAMDSAAMCYWNGFGVSKNQDKAREWWKRQSAANLKLAKAGDKGAMFHLSMAQINENGEKMSEDTKKYWQEMYESSGLSESEFKELREFVNRTGTSKY